MSFGPRALSHSSHLLVGIVPGSFVTAGAGVDPTVFDGAIQSVQQLDDGLISFYRVTLDEQFLAKTHSLHVGGELLADTEDLSVDVVKKGFLVADGPGGGPFPAQTDSQVDILIKDAGVDNVVAGRRVYLTLFSKQT